MFTGIIREIGKIESLSRGNSLIKFGIKSTVISESADSSDSISVNGACLTLIYKDKGVLFFEAIASTLRNTNLKRLKKGDFVNLEPALGVGDKLGGHFVLGHVDAELKLRRVIIKRGYRQLEIDLPSIFRKFVLENGSVAVEGVSLTVKKILPKVFTADVIPFTCDNTNIKYKKAGSWLNVEFDQLLKRR